MTHLIVTDLAKDKALDTEAMLSVKGGFSGYVGGYLPGPSYAPGYAGITDISKSLTNINTQLNIAVLSQDVFQNNSNNVFQF